MKGLSLEQLQTLSRNEPHNVPALLALGRELNRVGRSAEALTPLERAAGLSPEEGRVREAWSLSQIAGGFATGAFGQLTQFVRSFPGNAVGRRALGRFYISQRAYRRAIEELEVAVKLAPNDPESWSLLASARQGFGETDSACEAAERALRLRPDSPEDTLLVATLYRDMNQPEKARRAFEAAAKLSPNDPIFLQDWARSLLKSGRPADLEQALSLASRCVTILPEDPAALSLLGEAQLAAGQPEKALHSLRRAAVLVPKGMPVSSLSANEPTQFLEPAPALAAARASIALGKVDEGRRWREIYARRQSLREAWRRMTDRVRRAPHDRAGFEEMARFLARRGDAAEVAKNLAQARSQATDAPAILTTTSALLREAGYAEEAVHVARRAVLLSPRNPSAYEALGTAQLAAGRGHEAAVAFAHVAGFVPAQQKELQLRLEAFYRERTARPTKAHRLYLLAKEQETRALGLPISTDRIEGLLREGLSLEPRNTDILRSLLQLLYDKNARSEALAIADALLAITPDDGLGLARRAILLLESPDAKPDLALLTADLAQALQQDAPGPAYFGLGLIAQRKKDFKEAVRLFRQSLEYGAEARVYSYLASAYDAQKQSALAEGTRDLLAKNRARDEAAMEVVRSLLARPNDRGAAEAAIRLFKAQGQPERAQVVQVDWERRHPARKEKEIR